MSSRVTDWKKSYRINENGCWIWFGSVLSGGYAHLCVCGRHYLAHRLAYEQTIGPIPAGTQLDHLCGVRNCINPAHLEPVSAAVNARRGKGTKLTASQVREIKLVLNEEGGACELRLAKEYKISRSAIHKILRGQSWKEIK